MQSKPCKNKTTNWVQKKQSRQDGLAESDAAQDHSKPNGCSINKFRSEACLRHVLEKGLGIT
jgi:hypothetical protein